MNAVKIATIEGDLSTAQYTNFLRGGSYDMDPDTIGYKSGEHFLTDKQLSSLATHLTGLACYDEVFTKTNEMKDRDTWVEFLEDDPFKVELPAWVETLHPFEKMLLFKALRSEKLELCMKQ